VVQIDARAHCCTAKTSLSRPCKRLKNLYNQRDIDQTGGI
jgi:hypothetical protein